jgi:hypothetical protein
MLRIFNEVNAQIINRKVASDLKMLGVHGLWAHV